MKTTWRQLPEPIRSVVEQHTGPVLDITEVSIGRSSDLSTVLHTGSGEQVFLKGVQGVSPRMRWLRNEITAGALAVGIAPAVRFHADIEDWLVVGFEYVSGRAASLAPGSPDLPVVAAVTAKICAIVAPGLRPVRDRWTLTDSWIKLAERAPAVVEGWDVDEMSRRTSLIPDLVRGTSLVHTDLHGEQFVLGKDGTAHVIDWGWPASGAPWIDAAFLLLRLIEAGHDPGEAERWALSLPGFANVDHAVVLDAFSAFIAGLWSCWALGDKPAPGADHRARLARDYAARRCGVRTTSGL